MRKNNCKACDEVDETGDSSRRHTCDLQLSTDAPIKHVWVKGDETREGRWLTKHYECKLCGCKRENSYFRGKHVLNQYINGLHCPPIRIEPLCLGTKNMKEVK